MKKVFLHLGIHKTATKFLQEDIFPKMPDIDYISKAKYERTLLDKILHQDFLAFNYRKDELRKDFFELAEDSDKLMLISNELLYGNIFFQNNNRFSILMKLKALFPEAKIILSIRGQRQMIDSIYREYLVQGGCDKMKDFLTPQTPRGKSILSYSPSLDPESLKYGQYLDEIVKLFGTENCCFIPYEKLVKTPQEYLKEIFQFIGSAADTADFTHQTRHGSMSNRALKFLRFMNRFNYSAMHGAGIFSNRSNIGHLIRRLGIGRLSRKKSPGFEFEIPVDYNEDNKYIDQKYKLKLEQDFSEFYFD